MEKLSEQGLEQRSGRGFGRYKKSESDAQATAKICRLGDVSERAILVRCLPKAVRGSEPRLGESGHR
jgi:hypothetical protein